ncbi:MAG: VWA domain-containing protein [Planctomycetota bacterium]|nr:MAG: VWA domain-containing protein [Planctomycetota bacterium]
MLNGVRADNATQRLANELERLGAIVAGCPQGLVVHLDPEAETWSFDWSTDVVTIPSEDLRQRPPDYCRGIMLHEAAHAALSLEWAFAPQARCRKYATLINVIEDLRIETWLPCRLPGSAAWLRPLREKMVAEAAETPWPQSHRAGFIRALFEEWVLGAPSADCPTQLAVELQALWEPLHNHRNCHPGHPAQQVNHSQRWQEWAQGQHWNPRAAWAPLPNRLAQIDAWNIATEHIFPFWDRLCAADGHRNELNDADLQQLLDLLLGLSRHIQSRARQSTPTDPEHALAQASAAASAKDHEPFNCDHAGETPGVGSFSLADQIERALTKHSQIELHWNAALSRVEHLCEQLGDELLRHLLLRQRSSWRQGLRQGSHADLRAVMQAEADPRRGEQVWQQMQLPDRVDPAIAVLVDRSGSMEGEPAEQALLGLIMLIEACLRCGIPCAVWTFHSDCQMAWDRHGNPDDVARNRLAEQVLDVQGSTNLDDALQVVSEAVCHWPEADRFVIVLTDGAVDCVDRMHQTIHALTGEGIAVAGLGIGPDTGAVEQHFPDGRGNLTVEQLPEALGDCLWRLLAV